MTTSINAEIIAVGTELLLGQIANTNAQWLSKQLAQFGVNVLYHGVVGDNPERVQETFESAQKRSRLVIVTGGLGPTEDDMTREAFSTLNNVPIIEHQPSLQKIETYFAKHNIPMTPNNRRQARVFKGAEVFENTAGMAPGMMIKQDKCVWFFLPGVPREMKRLFLDNVQPYIKQMAGNETTIKSTILKFAGIGESQLEHELKDLISKQHNPTIAPLSQLEGNIIRLTAKAQTTEEATRLLNETKSHIINRLAEYYVGCDEDTLESVVVKRLKETQRTIGAAESLTGGLFTSKLISVPGASDICSGGIVCYHNTQKKALVGVSEHTLSTYGAVSEQCALEMAIGARTVLETDIGIGFTGAAGPDPSENKPAGTVYVAISDKNGSDTVHQLSLEGDRNTIRQKAVIKGMEFLYKILK